MPNLVSLAAALLFVLLPVQCVVLPMNMAPVDVVGAIVLPLGWLWLWHARQPLQLPFLPAVLLILLTTAVSCLTSLDPTDSASVLIKEAYLYAWFATIASLYVSLPAALARRLTWAWLLAGLGNGALVLAQFVQPELLAAMNAGLRGLGSLDPFRPSGLFENSNAAAVFQLSVFAPLLRLGLRRGPTLALGALLLAMMLGTGSMAGAMGFGLGGTALLLFLGVRRDWSTASRFVATALVASAVLGLAIAVALHVSPDMNHRLQYVMTGRSTYSAESRYAIWGRGAGLLLAQLPPLGVGPDMWKRIDGHELHNDLLSFAVERGPAAVLGLLLLAAIAVARAVQVIRSAPRPGLGALVVPAGLVGMATIAQTHEVFHQRPLWLLLALLDVECRRRASPIPLLFTSPPPFAAAVQRRAAATTLRTDSMT